MNNARIARKAQHGFTLVELLITVAIVAILAIIGATAYASFGAKAQVAEAFNLVEGVKHAYMVRYNEDGGSRGDYSHADLFDASTDRDDFSGKYVQMVNLQSGEITVQFRASADAPLAGGLLIMHPYETTAGAIQWRCSPGPIPTDGADVVLSPAGTAGGTPASTLQATNIDQSLLPRECRS
jgi:type IV pilus assembly protein PilA